MTTEQMLIAAIGALAAASVVLWRYYCGVLDKRETQCAKCREACQKCRDKSENRLAGLMKEYHDFLVDMNRFITAEEPKDGPR